MTETLGSIGFAPEALWFKVKTQHNFPGFRPLDVFGTIHISTPSLTLTHTRTHAHTHTHTPSYLMMKLSLSSLRMLATICS